MTTNKATPAPSINEQIKGLVKSHKNQPITTSRIIAQFFEKNHRDVLRDIQRLEIPKEIHERNFALVKYKDAKGEMRPMYELNRDGFFLLVMGYTGAKAMMFKLRFIEAFNLMEQKLQERQEREVLLAKDFVALHSHHSHFADIMQDVPTIIDPYDRKCYHYILALERLGFSTRSGSVWKRSRKHPSMFVHDGNRTYVVDNFILNMYLGKLFRHNNKVFKSKQAELPFNTEGGVL